MITIKKGSIAMVGLFITATLGIILLAYLLIPSVKTIANANTYAEDFARTNNSLNQTKTLTYSNIVSILSVANDTTTLSEGSNFTRSGAVLTFYDGKAPATTYTVTYSAYSQSYNLTSTEGVLFALVILAALIGIIYWIFVSFGLA